MEDLSFYSDRSTVTLKQDSDDESVVIYEKDVPELLNLLNEYVEKKFQEDKVEGVTIEEGTLGDSIFLRQDYDDDTVCINKEELPKLIKLLQKYC